jgi:hypothetical protein
VELTEGNNIGERRWTLESDLDLGGGGHSASYLSHFNLILLCKL